MIRPTRVTIECDTVGGVWTFALELATALRRRGHDARLAAIGPGDVRSRRRLADAGAAGVPADFLAAKLEWEPGVTRDDLRRSASWLAAVAAGADVVHLCSYAHAAGWDGPPCVLTCHSDVVTWWRAVHGEDPPGAYDEYRCDLAAAWTRADGVVTPTRAYGDLLAGDPRLPPRLWEVVPNGRTMPRVDGGEREGLLAVGRFWDEGKNVHVLTQAAAAAADHGGLTLVGPGDTPPNVRCLGELDPGGVRDAMSRAAVFANPALYEPFGLAALEAARCGCALLLSDLPAHREVWADAATYVDPRDPAAWAGAARELLADAALRRRLAAAAGGRAARFTAESTADAYADLYRRLTHPAQEVAA